MFDPTTIGKSPCQINLGRILAEMDDKKLLRKVTNIIHESNTVLNQVQCIRDKTIRRATIELWRKFYLDSTISICPEVVRTHLRNCIVTQFKKTHAKERSNVE